MLPVLRDRPSLPSALNWLWNNYFRIDRTDWGGRPTFAGMREVLDECGITDPAEREAIFETWFAMSAAEGEVRERQRESEEKEQERKAKEVDHSVHPGRRR